jgi:hypothetical protein
MSNVTLGQPCSLGVGSLGFAAPAVDVAKVCVRWWLFGAGQKAMPALLAKPRRAGVMSACVQDFEANTARG